MSVMWVAAGVSVLVAVGVAVTALARPRLRTRLAVPAAVSAAVSLAVTLAHVIGVTPAAEAAAAVGMIESVALMVVTGLLVRYTPPRQAAPIALATALASATWLLRFFVAASPLEGVGASAFWGVGAVVAAAVGAYLRFLDVRQSRAVAGARTVLRLRLARDLHDFVAHDISEMVAHAQAGQVAGDPLKALERVAAAGQRAMSMLDRTLDTLHHDRPLAPAGDLGGVREAAERFSDAGPARVHLTLDPSVTVPAETAALAYRIVIEGLTNVRRHAPHATRVDLRVGRADGVLELSMTNDGVTRQRGGRRSGSGLPGLTALVEEQGGTLVSAAVPDGWSLTARLPLAQSSAWSPESSSPTTRKASAAPSG